MRSAIVIGLALLVILVPGSQPGPFTRAQSTINKVRDGKRRRVLIEVRNHPEYTVEGRKYYYAPAQ